MKEAGNICMTCYIRIKREKKQWRRNYTVHYTGTYEYTYKSNTGKILTGKLKGWAIRTLSDSQMELDTGSKTMSFSRVSDIPILHDDKNVIYNVDARSRIPVDGIHKKNFRMAINCHNSISSTEIFWKEITDRIPYLCQPNGFRKSEYIATGTAISLNFWLILQPPRCTRFMHLLRY